MARNERSSRQLPLFGTNEPAAERPAGILSGEKCVAWVPNGARAAHLIVAGALGHGRLWDWAFGDVTRALALNSDRCVLASH